ncbi:hypothetical protein [Alicyclobacillus mengziensis]|uniref:Uncharacterized protein n=1 Tax=Alicyclobacillus mengziensis TaxID=2931921 RepID=A0A9X7VY05_9BACL|nr:hypothetical protein [Alicyclobacillus mengziensis]QSO45848.1 hypothetical protein JZ786_15020 [Alicyclobacillus mengziensis]
MKKGILLWGIWLFALFTGVYGTAITYQGITTVHHTDLIYGVPILLLGIWITGNIWASARQAYHRQKALMH